MKSVVTCGCETWTLSVRDINRLLVFERYGPVDTEEEWRISIYDKLEKLVRGEDMDQQIRAQRIKWWGISKQDGKKNKE
jgi:hypothetical protein